MLMVLALTRPARAVLFVVEKAVAGMWIDATMKERLSATKVWFAYEDVGARIRMEPGSA